MKEIKLGMNVKERIVRNYAYCVFVCPFTKEINGKLFCLAEECGRINQVEYEYKERVKVNVNAKVPVEKSKKLGLKRETG